MLTWKMYAEISGACFLSIIKTIFRICFEICDKCILQKVTPLSNPFNRKRTVYTQYIVIDQSQCCEFICLKASLRSLLLDYVNLIF